MAVPRSRLSNQRKNLRRAHHAKKQTHTLTCSNCQAAKRPHTICQECGFYGKRQVIQKEAE